MIKVFLKYQKMSDAELMRRFQNNDQKAFEELFNRFERRAYGFFFKYTRNQEETQDLVQELFLKIVDKKHLFNPKRSFSPWFFRIASNLAKTNYKKIQRLDFVINENTSERSPEEQNGSRNEIKKEIRSAVEQLTEPHKSTFILRHYTSLSIKEIAETMECNEGTVKSRLFNAHKRVKEQLKENTIVINF